MREASSLAIWQLSAGARLAEEHLGYLTSSAKAERRLHPWPPSPPRG